MSVRFKISPLTFLVKQEGTKSGPHINELLPKNIYEIIPQKVYCTSMYNLFQKDFIGQVSLN